jgi:predicted DNA-binding transcriptional regulator AlpA
MMQSNEEGNIPTKSEDQGELSGRRLLSLGEVSSWLQVPAATLYRWRYMDSGPRSVRVGRHVRYLVSDVEEWLSAAPSRGGES